jgi:hypothetical protein
MMTVTAIMAGLLPILWGNGTGATLMKRIAAPMVGGMISSTALTLIVIPAVYSLWRERQLMHEGCCNRAPLMRRPYNSTTPPPTKPTSQEPQSHRVTRRANMLEAGTVRAHAQ